jgi:hypothetical protein
MLPAWSLGGAITAQLAAGLSALEVSQKIMAFQ